MQDREGAAGDLAWSVDQELVIGHDVKVLAGLSTPLSAGEVLSRRPSRIGPKSRKTLRYRRKSRSGTNFG
jgi:hypothetical protein